MASGGRAHSLLVGKNGKPGLRSRSSAVSTATTPGAFTASDTSMPEIVAWAKGVRTNAAKSTPSGRMLST